jgi:ATP-dependent helicase/nuclease subunit A
MTTVPLNPEQQAAVEATGEVFVSAGAGTGKTSVIVERYVRAICDRGIDIESVLLITYTRKAAAELRSRIRTRLRDDGRADLARSLDGAWVSTIHGFCLRLLRAHPFEAGLDPAFGELDEAQGSVVRGESFERALTDFCADGDPQRMRLLSTYTSSGLRRMLTGVYATLRSAGRELVLELGAHADRGALVANLRAAAETLVGDPDATDRQRAAAQAALDLVQPETLPERLLDLRELRASGVRAETYEEARKHVVQVAFDELAEQDRVLLQELLIRFADEYAAAKSRESVLDFEDLQLAARRLLRDHPAIRAAEQERFRIVMVDEFQDTNRLQCEIVDLIVGDRPDAEVFYVGDEFQSIYRFRHADVSAFRERRASAANVLSLTRNYRSRSSVLDAVNYLFAPSFGDEFEPLAAGGTFDQPVLGHAVELLVTDKASYREAGVDWRRAEAQSIARRVRELVDAGAARPGEIVLLFAAGTAAETYEDELREAGLPTYRATGRGYFGQQQVADLLAYLALVRNRYDDVALATVLASPLVGVSNDSLVLIRRAAGRRPLYAGIERSLPHGMAAGDARLVNAFKQRFERLVRLLGRVSLEVLCDRIVSEHDYDLAILAHPDGRRRYANLRKLGRLARSYEELRGNDLEGFVSFVRDQDALGAREQEAVAIEEDADAIRLMTIHAAKGLEFPVVIVADAGREGAPPAPDEIVALPDGRFGFRIVDAVGGRRHGVFGFDAVRAAANEQEREERDRLYYVAMTRAVDRLIVSGAIDPGRRSDRETPIGWVLRRLEADAELAAAEAGAPLELVRGDARILVRLDRYQPEEAAAVPQARDDEPAPVGQLALFDEIPDAPPALLGLQLAPLATLPEPPLHVPRRLSFSALSLHDRCSYRYYVERVVGMRPARPLMGGDAGLAATEIGDAVHRLLEAVDLTAPATPSPEALAATVSSWYPAVSADELDRIRAFVDVYCESELARRIARLGTARPERPFAFTHDGVLLRGRLDVLSVAAGRALVLDYKTNALGDHDPEVVVETEYGLQRLVYALALLRAGLGEVEVVYHFLERVDAVVSASFTADDVGTLEDELSAAIGRVRSGDFRPSPSVFACAGCPARGRVCAGVGSELPDPLHEPAATA